eukprot:1408803-Prymnesium_polylepis.1
MRAVAVGASPRGAIRQSGNQAIRQLQSGGRTSSRSDRSTHTTSSGALSASSSTSTRPCVSARTSGESCERTRGRQRANSARELCGHPGRSARTLFRPQADFEPNSSLSLPSRKPNSSCPSPLERNS